VRAGKLLKISLDAAFAVIFRNQIDIPHGSTQDEVHRAICAGDVPCRVDDLCTDIVVVDHKPAVDDALAKRFASFLQSERNGTPPQEMARYSPAAAALNDGIVAYYSATQLSGGTRSVARLTFNEFLASLRHADTVICAPDYEFSDDDIEHILGEDGRPSITAAESVDLDLADCAPAQLASIERYVHFHRKFIFYQFALDARSRMHDGDYVSALLFAIIALEAAHAIVLRMCLESKLATVIADRNQRAKHASERAENLLVRAGFSAMVELTSTVLLDDRDRPKVDDVIACQRAITIRNEIMHALTKKHGYKLRNRKNDDLTRAYTDALKVYYHFCGIIKRAEASTSGSP
jgi:hypothetical protein